MTRIGLVRHGETDWNREMRIQGRTDIPLNNTGRQQAQDAASALENQGWTAVYSSPLSRAHETAQIIADHLGLGEVRVRDDLVERDYGGAEGMNAEQLHAAYPGGLNVDGRESRTAVAQRVYEALRAIEAENPDGSALVVCHGGVIGSVVRDLTARERPRYGEKIPNGSVHLLSVSSGTITLTEFNGEQVLPPVPAEASAEFELTSPN